MLPLEALKYLHDIVSACEKVERFIVGVDLGAYCRDDLRRSAVERQFEVIGEAMAQLIKRHEELTSAFSECRRIIAFRNRLIHGYADVDDEVVWGVIAKDLPNLRREAARLLAEEDEAKNK